MIYCSTQRVSERKGEGDGKGRRAGFRFGGGGGGGTGGGEGGGLPPSNAGSGMWRPGSQIGFSRSLSRSRLPGAVYKYAQPVPAIDALIAATARVHGMTVVTRKVKDFELAGVQVLNPFAG